VEVGLICIFIEACILNETRVSSYIQDILRDEDNLVLRDKTIDYKGILNISRRSKITKCENT